MAKEHKLLFQLNAQLNGGFNGAFSKAQAEFSRLGKEIQTLNRTQSDISGYQKLQGAIAATTQKLTSLQRQQQALSREKGALEQQIREAQAAGQSTAALERQKAALEREEARLGQRIETTNTSLQHQQERLSATGSRLQQAGVNTNQLASESARLGSQLEELRGQQEEAAEGAGDFGASTVDAFSAAASAVAAAGLVSAFGEIAGAYRECVTIAADFEASMSTVEALSGANEKELYALTASAKEMGAATKYTATESANAFQYMALAGWDTNKMLSGIEPILNLATAAEMDLAQASDIVTDYLSAFGLSADDAAGFADQMAYAMSHSNTNVVQLGEAYKNCAATAHSLKYSVEDTTAVIMTMANAGIKGGEAGTALNAIMSRLATDTKECATELESYGVHVYGVGDKMSSLSSILNGVAGIWTNLTDKQQANLAKTIAGTNHYKSLQTIMNGCSQAAAAGGQSFNDYAAALSDCSGTASKMAGIMLDNMNGQLTLAQSAWDAVKTTIGEQFTPVLKNLLKVATDGLTLVNKILAANPALIKGITSFIAVGGVLTTTVVGAAAAMKLFAAASGLVAAVLPGINIFAAIAGIAGLTGAVVAMSSATNDAVPPVSELAEAANKVDGAMQAAKDSISDAEAETEAAAASANKYIDMLDALGSATRHTSTEKQQYHHALMMLCEVMPELSEYIDLETNSIKGGTEALREHVDALKQDAQQVAYQEAYTEALKAQVDAEKELEKRTFEKWRAEQKLTSLQEQRQKIVDKMNKKDANNVSDFLAYDKLERQLASVDGQIDDTEASIENLNTAISDGESAVKTATEGLAAMEEWHKQLKFSMEDNLTQAEIDQLMALDSALESSAGQLTMLENAYDEAYEEAYEAFTGMFDLFDKANIDAQATVANAQAALESQYNYWKTYNDNITFIKSKSAEDLGITQENYNQLINVLKSGDAQAVGLSQDIVNQVKAGNVQAVAQMAKTASDVAAMQKSAADATADWVSGFSEKADEVVDKVKDSVQAMDLSSEATRAANNTLNAYLKAVEDKGARIQTAYRNIANSIRAEINSIPSFPTPGVSGGGEAHFWANGFASGTLNAPPGWSWVGEQGPELINLHGGEAILPADTSLAFAAAAAMPEMQITAFAPQVIEAIGAYANPPVQAESAIYAPAASASPTAIINIHIDGNATPETVDRLYDFRDEMMDMMQEIMAEERIAARRNTYI